MRIIHTSDWHLGQTLHNFDRHLEHQCFLDWLLDTLVAEQADALLISGDIFDTANPSATSQRQLYRFLQQAKTRVPHLNTVLIAGNHDSPGRLDAPIPLLEALDVSVVGSVPRGDDGQIDPARLVLPLRDRHGSTAAWCLAVPFLRPGDVPRIETAPDSQDDPYRQGITLLYQQALAQALAQRQSGQALVAMGHCHMVGGTASEDSERRIVIGGTEALSAGLFDSRIAYAALGHLHLAQRVAQQERLRYCGSPLPLSFAEVGYTHQVLRVDLDGEALASVTPLPVPRAVALLRIPAVHAPLASVLQDLSAMKFEAQDDLQRQPYLEVRVRLEQPEPGLRARIEAVLEGQPVRLAKIDIRFAAAATGTGPDAAPDGADPTEATHRTALETLEQLQPEEVFQRLYRSKYQGEAPAELATAFAELLQPAEGTP